MSKVKEAKVEYELVLMLERLINGVRQGDISIDVFADESLKTIGAAGWTPERVAARMEYLILTERIRTGA